MKIKKRSREEDEDIYKKLWVDDALLDLVHMHDLMVVSFFKKIKRLILNILMRSLAGHLKCVSDHLRHLVNVLTEMIYLTNGVSVWGPKPNVISYRTENKNNK